MTVAYLLALAVAHEAGHAVTARALGYQCRPFVRFPVTAGVAVVAPRGGLCGRDRALIGLGGPLVSLALVCPLWLVSPTLAVCSFVLGAVSLIPIRPMDGWHVREAFVSSAGTGGDANG